MTDILFREAPLYPEILFIETGAPISDAAPAVPAPTVVSAPAIAPASATAGATLTITPGVYSGAATITRVLLRGAVDVTSQVSGNTLTNAVAGAYVWRETATNSEGVAVVREASATVTAAAIPAPTVVSAPAIAPASATAGATLTITPGVYSGAATVERVLLRGAVDVTSQVSGNTLTNAAAGAYVWRETATNSEGVAVVREASATVTAATTAAPAITRQPSVLPASPRIGDNITIDIGAASGTPAAVATWDFTLDGASIKAGLTGGIAMEIAAAGTYVLSVSWANGVGSPAVATTVTFEVEAASAAIDYATAALLYLDKDSAYSGTESAVATITPIGTKGVLLNNNSGTTPVVKVADGWQITDGNRLQTPGFTQVAYDGLFVVMDVTLASYGSALGQMLEGTGSRLSIRNNAGNLQAIGPASGQSNIGLGGASYGSRIVIAAQFDCLADLLSGYTSAGAPVSAAHVDAGFSPGQFVLGRYCNMTIHRVAIVARPVGGAWPVTLDEVYSDFTAGA